MARTRKKAVSFEIPDKEPGEEPATAKQLAYIKHLADEIELPSDLGKWQASSLITELKEAKEDLDSGRGGSGCAVFAIGIAILVGLAAMQALSI